MRLKAIFGSWVKSTIIIRTTTSYSWIVINICIKTTSHQLIHKKCFNFYLRGLIYYFFHCLVLLVLLNCNFFTIDDVNTLLQFVQVTILKLNLAAREIVYSARSKHNIQAINRCCLTINVNF